MEIRSTPHGAAAVLDVAGVLDTPASRDLEHAVQAALAAHRFLIIDLAGAQLLTSACIRVLITAHRKAKAAGGALWLSGLNVHVEEVFAVSGLANHFQTAPTQGEALARCQPGAGGSAAAAPSGAETTTRSALADRVVTALGRGVPGVRVPRLTAVTGAAPSALGVSVRRALARGRPAGPPDA